MKTRKIGICVVALLLLSACGKLETASVSDVQNEESYNEQLKKAITTDSCAENNTNPEKSFENKEGKVIAAGESTANTLSTEDLRNEGEVEEARVKVLNMSLLDNISLPSEAGEILIDNLNDYMNYYDNTGSSYEGVIMEDTLKDDFIMPSFHVYIEEIDLDIECLYHTTRDFFFLYSRYNPEG